MRSLHRGAAKRPACLQYVGWVKGRVEEMRAGQPGSRSRGHRKTCILFHRIAREAMRGAINDWRPGSLEGCQGCCGPVAELLGPSVPGPHLLLGLSGPRTMQAHHGNAWHSLIRPLLSPMRWWWFCLNKGKECIFPRDKWGSDTNADLCSGVLT